jgi:monofunctional biosynthetic peptidoglycan transglycosylase
MSTDLLFDFSSSSADDPSDWRSVDDPVMGGVSESTFEATPNGAAFTGVVSLEQGGGFCSVRAPEASYDWSDADGLRLRLRGDGNRYWLTAYTDPGGPISYRAPLQPPEQWTEIDVPFARLTPYRRGSKVPDAPSFAPSAVRTIGFLIADEQAGPFRLDVAWIRPRTTE